METIESLANLVRSIIEGISKRKRLMFFLFLFFVSSLTLLYFESHTRLLYYYSLERKISLISQLNQLAQDDVRRDKELYPIYIELAKEILNRKVTPMEFPTITTFTLYKFLTGASFGLLFLFIGLIFRRPKAMQGALLVASFFGFIAIFIPIIGSIWINTVVLMIVQLFLLSFAPDKNSPNRPTRPRTA